MAGNQVQAPDLSLNIEQRLDIWVKQYRSKLERYCSRLLGSTEDGVDAAQDAIIKAWKYIKSFDERQGLDRWMFTIARNVCYDRGRVNSVDTVALEAAEGIPDRSDTLNTSTTSIVVEIAINKLGVEDQEVLYLVDVLGLGHAMASFVLGEGKSKLRWRLWAARRAAQEYLYAEEVAEACVPQPSNHLDK